MGDAQSEAKPLRGIDASGISQFKALSASSGSKVQSVSDGGEAKPLIQSENLATENLVTHELNIWSMQTPNCFPSNAISPRPDLYVLLPAPARCPRGAHTQGKVARAFRRRGGGS